MHAENSSTAKSSVNLRIRTDLKVRARELGVNLSRTLERSLEAEIRQRQQQSWATRNREAIVAYNHRIDERGPTLAAFRRF